ncbi:MipA/OmpV family protein [Erythrobacter vulgaris]|uniref:MipA/OmpV family protein n=1 Tax=Qipengyuania vulgaris TaxID=291985 RepID=A0A844XPS9_9SPHN|nr:MipA/OmpV family protein [Qipengyuania vulgaris]MXO47414.1 MipA/OmpV family protein [Qipengyuania vulgaris]
MIRFASAAAATLACALSVPAMAQQTDVEDPLPSGPPDTVFDGDFVSVGVGVGYNASYSGSDDYNVNILPIVQGSIGGIDINPRPAGLAIDLVPDADEGISFSAGPMIRLRSDRNDADDINDDVVAAYGELDRAVELGGSVGIKFPQLLNPFDSLSLSLDATWDVAGAHDGRVLSPSVTYFTPLSRATAASLSLSTSLIDDNFADYYYSVPPTNALLPDGEELPGFQAEGGVQSYGINLLLAHDLSGDVADGGLSVIGIGGWSKLVGDAADTPFTSIRGDDDQYFVALGVGYTF